MTDSRPDAEETDVIDQSKLSYRPITAKDKAAILELASNTWGGNDYLTRVFDHWIDKPESPFIGLFSSEALVGCGRMLRLNRSSAWLEALRVFPQYHQQGLGRLIAIYMIEVARKAGYQDLLFSTYFDNIGSIRINEALGFTKIATFTTLNLLIKDLSTIPAVTADHPDLSITDEVCRPDQITWNGWQFVLPNTDNLERFFPGVETITTNDSVMMIANNTKSPGQELEICWLEGPAAAGAGLCLEYAIAECHRRAIPRLHLMLPEAIPHEPFLRAGFTIYEQPKDVFVYRGTIEQLEC